MQSLPKVTLGICLSLMFSCQSSDENEALSGDAENVNGYVEVKKTVRRIGVRNFQEINMTMSLLTGIDSKKSRIKNDYEIISSMLPLNNSVSAFHGPVQVGVFRLASSYCDQLINKEIKTRGAMFPDIDFASPPSVSLPPTARSEVATAFIDVFWGRSSAVRPPKEESVAKITRFIGDALGETGGSGSYMPDDTQPMRDTKEVLFSVCNAVLASAPVIFH